MIVLVPRGKEFIMTEFEEALEDALDEWGIKEVDVAAFTDGFEAGWMAGVDRGMEVEHELSLELRAGHEPAFDV